MQERMSFSAISQSMRYQEILDLADADGMSSINRLSTHLRSTAASFAQAAWKETEHCTYRAIEDVLPAGGPS